MQEMASAPGCRLAFALQNTLILLKRVPMGHIFDFKDAMKYERWISDEKNRVILDLEIRLMQSMLKPVCGETLLDIGCGTGISLRPYLGKGIQLTGIDPSTHMLDIARVNLGHRVDLYRGISEDLPFEDNAFNHAVLFLTLEFTDDPEKAIAEACRVAKDCVFIGILNKYSLVTLQHRVAGLFRDSIYRHARFFSVGEVRSMVYGHTGRIPFIWRTVLQLPGSPRGMIHRMESNPYVQRSPFGAFAGMISIPVPRLRTIPLALKTRVNHVPATGERVASCAGDYKNQVAGK